MFLVLREGLLLGMAGAVLGGALGWGLSKLLAQALRMIFGVPIRPDAWSAWLPLVALVLGPGLALASAYVPARMATKVPPLDVLRVSQAGGGWLVAPRPSTLAGLAAGLVGSVLMALAIGAWVPANWAVAAAIILLLALLLLFPVALRPLAAVAVLPLRPLGRMERDLAHRQALRHPGRTVLTCSVLFVSVAASVCMGAIITQVVHDVRSWARATARADFLVRVAVPNLSTGAVPGVPEGFAEEVARMPGTLSVEKLAFIAMDGEEDRLLAIVREFDHDETLPLELVGPPVDPQGLRRDLRDGAVVLGDILANKLGRKAGDVITAEHAGRKHTLRVAAISRSYLMGGMSFYMDWGAAAREFGPPVTAALGITARKGAHESLEKEVRELCRERGLMFQTYASFQQMVQSLLDAVVGSLWGLFALSFLIAGFGITNTLIMNVLEQTRELGLMRVVGMKAGQVRRMVLAQALLIGLLGLVPGIAAGIALTVLVRASVVAVLGKALDVSVALTWVVPYAVLMLLLVVACGWVPAMRATRLKVLDCVRAQ
jgi:putative ABC transport system permease protein